MQTADLYASVTASIVTALEAGGLPPWRKPWNGGGGGFLPLRHMGVPYRGVNVLILWIQGEAMGYGSSHWLTFKQALEYGGSVRKGEKSTAILFCQPISKRETAADGTEADSKFWIAKTYRVFNADQCDGLPEKFATKPVNPLDPAQRIEHADAFIANTQADIRFGGGSAFYRPSEDYIQLPHYRDFTSPEGFTGTALHELAHWTGAPHRLNRFSVADRTKQDYAQEEIVAELASCFLSAALGIEPVTTPDHAAYLAFWIEAMKADPRYLFTAASKAQAAADFLHGMQPGVAE